LMLNHPARVVFGLKNYCHETVLPFGTAVIQTWPRLNMISLPSRSSNSNWSPILPLLQVAVIELPF